VANPVTGCVRFTMAIEDAIAGLIGDVLRVFAVEFATKATKSNTKAGSRTAHFNSNVIHNENRIFMLDCLIHSGTYVQLLRGLHCH
jgi:hypothetical protein